MMIRPNPTTGAVIVELDHGSVHPGTVVEVYDACRAAGLMQLL
jgi:hypothetical protein